MCRVVGEDGGRGMTEPKTHELKLNQRYFDDVAKRRKPFEIRYNDRNYQEGDNIVFYEVDDDGNRIENDDMSFRYIYAKIGFMLHDFVGLQDGYVAFALEELETVIRKPHVIMHEHTFIRREDGVIELQL
jgi:hypothetical protein